jgi:hypothetical protein
MNGIAVRVDRIKGRCLGDITCTAVNYWVLVVRGGHEARFAESPRFTCMNLHRFVSCIHLPFQQNTT